MSQYCGLQVLLSRQCFRFRPFLTEDVILRGKIHVLAANAVSWVPFNLHQTITVVTPTRGQHFFDHVTKKTKLDFSGPVGNVDLFLANDTDNFVESFLKN